MSLFGVIGGIGRTIGPVLGGLLSSPADNYSLFRGTVFESHPFALPCLVVSANCLLVFLVAFFDLHETLIILPSRRQSHKNNNNNNSDDASSTRTVSYRLLQSDEEAPENSINNNNNKSFVVDNSISSISMIGLVRRNSNNNNNSKPFSDPVPESPSFSRRVCFSNIVTGFELLLLLLIIIYST